MSKHALPCIDDSIRRVLKVLEKKQVSIDCAINAAVKQSSARRRKEALLISVPGIARTLIAELPELGSVDRNRIAAPVGLAPRTRQFGQWRGTSFIAGARAPVRTSLFIGALLPDRHSAALKTSSDRLIKVGKPKLIALIAAVRKLIAIPNTILRDGSPWQTA